MPNAIRGETSFAAGGRSYTLLLTLGALAEIEDGLGLTALGDIGPRLKQVRAGDLAIVAAALFKGGGNPLTPAEVLALPCELGALVAAIATAFDRSGFRDGVPFVGPSDSPSG